MREAREQAWWKRAVIYQIYPRSFQDANGDGIGDLDGIRRRLDYLVWLGVDAVWISPFFRSPMKDFGYDICNFRDVDPIFGSLETFDRLLAEAHGRGLKVILDFVPNHTSSEHPWFRESRSSRDNPKRDWYIWRDGGPGGGPPNNWQSNFGRSAWERDAATGQFYYHAFLLEEPDLNWRNPAVVEAMHDVLRFWLDRGVDGFRVDAISHLVEDELLRANPEPPDGGALRRNFSEDRPETHERVQGMRAVLDRYPDKVLIGEAHLPVALTMRYYGGRAPGFDLPFNFILLRTGWNARAVEAAIDHYLNLLPQGAWANWVLGNHDESRVASRIGRDAARGAAMLIMTVGGTPFVYNGEELGLENAEVPPSRIQDTAELRNPGQGYGRDPERSPMPWNGAPHSGFTTGKPWLPIGDKNVPRNVAALKADPRSVLTLYRRLIALRRAEPAFVDGDYLPQGEQGSVLAYTRRKDGRSFFVALNMASQAQAVRLPDRGTVLLSSYLDREGERCDEAIDLRPDEGAVVQL